MHGPFPLCDVGVDMHVPVRVGGICLVAKNPRQVALVTRVDSGLRETIRGYKDKYAFFWFQPEVNAVEAYKDQCWLYHRYAGSLEDATHPKSPGKEPIPCPVCGK